MKRFTFLFSLILIAAGCGGGVKAQPDFENVPHETIDFFGLREQAVEDIPDSYKHNLRYIPLSTGDGEYLFGNADKIIIRNERIYVMDRRSRKLIAFDMDGNPIAYVGRQGRGPGEYIVIADFDVDETGKVIVVDGNQDVLLTYDENYKFLNSVKPVFDIDGIKCLPKDKLFINLATWNTLEYADTQVLITDRDLNVEKHFLNYGEYIDNNFIFSSNLITENSDGILYNQTNSNDVYSFTPAGDPQKLYTFDFGTRNVPNDIKKDVETNLEKYDNYCLLLHELYMDDDHIIGYVYIDGASKLFLIDKKSGTRYIPERPYGGGYARVVGFHGNTVISLLAPGEEWNEIEPEGMPENVLSHLRGENYVICLYEL